MSSFVLSQVYDLLLNALYKYRFLTCTQATTLLYKAGMLTTVRARLKTLADNQYLLPVQLPTVRGQSPIAYALARKGITYLASQGMDVRGRFRPVEEKEKSYAFLQHTLKTNDVVIAASKLPTYNPAIKIYEVRHEQELTHTPLAVSFERNPGQDASGKIRMQIIPDAWLDIRLTRETKKARRFTIWLELDRGTVETKQFKRKLQGIVTAVESGAYEALFHAKTVQVVFATTAGEKRVHQMQKWTRELAGTSLETGILSGMFLFTALPETIEAEVLFCTPVWHTADNNSDSIALLTP